MNLIILIVFILQTALSVVLGTFFGDSLSICRFISHR